MFAAIVPPLAIRKELAHRLSLCPGVRWTPTADLHVTLLFEPACPDVPALIACLGSATRGPVPFRMRVGGAGSFPARRGSTLWMAARGAAEQDESALRALRVAVGARADAVGHLTLARVRSAGADEAAALAAITALNAREWRVSEIGLYESLLATGPGERSRYELLARVPFGET